LARAYSRAAHALRLAGVVERPFWHSISHALELSLKAALLNCGSDEFDLVLMNHRISEALPSLKAVDHQLMESLPADLIECLDSAHSQQKFRYPRRTQIGLLPDPAYADEALQQHLRVIETWISASRNLAAASIASP
jgi:hypothetical protein